METSGRQRRIVINNNNELNGTTGYGVLVLPVQHGDTTYSVHTQTLLVTMILWSTLLDRPKCNMFGSLFPLNPDWHTLF